MKFLLIIAVVAGVLGSGEPCGDNIDCGKLCTQGRYINILPATPGGPARFGCALGLINPTYSRVVCINSNFVVQNAATVAACQTAGGQSCPEGTITTCAVQDGNVAQFTAACKDKKIMTFDRSVTKAGARGPCASK